MFERRKVPISQWAKELANTPTVDLQVIGLYDGKRPVIPIEMLGLLGFTLDSTSGVVRNDASGQVPVAEANSAAILGHLPYIGGLLGPNDQDGTIYDKPWKYSGAKTVTADANGNPGGAAVDIAGLGAGITTDIAILMVADTKGNYTIKWCEDPSGTPAAAVPDLSAGETYMMPVGGGPYGPVRQTCATADTDFGRNAGANGAWPNSSKVTFYFYYRELE